jgi:hypothetical protein
MLRCRINSAKLRELGGPVSSSSGRQRNCASSAELITTKARLWKERQLLLAFWTVLASPLSVARRSLQHGISSSPLFFDGNGRSS